jgi:hypothetical protein
VAEGRAEDDIAACGPGDLELTVRWERHGTGLRGEVIARNLSDRACRLASKPGVTPLRADGSPLPTQTIISLELRSPGYVVLQPGERAAAPVLWSSWCGEPAGDRARVDWPGGSAIATVHGPAQPDCVPDTGANLTSSWFDLIE